MNPGDEGEDEYSMQKEIVIILPILSHIWRPFPFVAAAILLSARVHYLPPAGGPAKIIHPIVELDCGCRGNVSRAGPGF
jgi:hypothetical protein